jgi:hypothetical protein
MVTVGNAMTDTETDELMVQLLDPVATNMYLPELAVEAFETTGFLTVDENPPPSFDHWYFNLVSVVTVERLIEYPTHTGLLLWAEMLGDTLTDTLTVAVTEQAPPPLLAVTV